MIRLLPVHEAELVKDKCNECGSKGEDDRDEKKSEANQKTIYSLIKIMSACFLNEAIFLFLLL